MIAYLPLTPEHAPVLSQIGRISLLESHGHSAPADIMEAYVARSFSEAACRTELADPNNLFTGVWYNGQPAGYAKIICNTPHPQVPLSPVTKLERIYLLKEFYGLGLGQGLLERAIRQSQAQADKGMWLDVWKKNDRAIRFYEKEGFESIGEGSFMLTEERTNPIWVMLRRY